MMSLTCKQCSQQNPALRLGTELKRQLAGPREETWEMRVPKREAPYRNSTMQNTCQPVPAQKIGHACKQQGLMCTGRETLFTLLHFMLLHSMLNVVVVGETGSMQAVGEDASSRGHELTLSEVFCAWISPVFFKKSE